MRPSACRKPANRITVDDAQTVACRIFDHRFQPDKQIIRHLNLATQACKAMWQVVAILRLRDKHHPNPEPDRRSAVMFK